MRFILITFLCLSNLDFLKGQENCFSEQFNTSLFNIPKSELNQKKIMKPLNKKQKYNPLFYIGSGILFVYQNLISEQLQSNCEYKISCSEFTKKSIQKYGLLRGFFIGINQLNSCLPNIYIEYDKYFITNEFKVNNEIYFINN